MCDSNLLGQKAGGPAMLCPCCKREVHPWPLGYRARCSAPEWVYCIRNDLLLDAIANCGIDKPAEAPMLETDKERA